jgi:accessory gene regulator protein AgrB
LHAVRGSIIGTLFVLSDIATLFPLLVSLQLNATLVSSKAFGIHRKESVMIEIISV